MLLVTGLNVFDEFQFPSGFMDSNIISQYWAH